jgi:NAD dependent epimerase/dehydratase family
MAEKVRAIITGATGMVGEGVLHECLRNDEVEKVLVVGRRSCEVSHPKLTEIVHTDFFDLSPIEDQLSAYNACFFCLGMSSVGVSKEDYERMTYDLTMNFAETLAKKNDEMTFCYISGSGTDSTGTSKLHWARIKGKVENDLQKLPFKNAFGFRIAFVKPDKDAKNTLTPYKFLGWLYPIMKVVSPNSATTLGEVGQAMINSVTKGYEKQVLEVADIIDLAER